MAACLDCGVKAGMGKKRCVPCADKEQARLNEIEITQRAELAAQKESELAEQQERERLAEIARIERLDKFFEERFGLLQELIDEGVTPYIYDSIVIDSYSFYNESPSPQAWTLKTETQRVGNETDLGKVRELGFLGWEVTQSIPINYGSTLYNSVGGNTVFAAAHSGLVVGANLILRMPITRKTLEEQRSFLKEYLIAEFPG